MDHAGERAGGRWDGLVYEYMRYDLDMIYINRLWNWKSCARSRADRKKGRSVRSGKHPF
jgi:hypothetical protein